MNDNILFIIPARYNSTRLPGKVLKPLGEFNSLQRVYNVTKKCLSEGDELRVVTDSDLVKTYCNENDIECEVSFENHQTGTDRACEPAYPGLAHEHIIIVSADLPTLTERGLKKFIEVSKLDINRVWTAVSLDVEGHTDLNKCKAVIKNNEIVDIYREATNDEHCKFDPVTIGIYSYDYSTLYQFTRRKRTPLERERRHEILRNLGHVKISAVQLEDVVHSLDSADSYESLKLFFKSPKVV